MDALMVLFCLLIIVALFRTFKIVNPFKMTEESDATAEQQIVDAALAVCQLEKLIIETPDYDQQLALIAQAKTAKAYLTGLYAKSGHTSTAMGTNVLKIADFR